MDRQKYEQLREYAEHAWLGLTPTEEALLGSGPLVNPDTGKLYPLFDNDEDIMPWHLMSVMKNPDYFPFVCKEILNIDILPYQHLILKVLWEHPFPMLVGSRGLGKTFIMAVYALLMALLKQGSKVIIVGAAFRQSKILFEYIERIYSDSPVLQHIVGKEGKPKYGTDVCAMRVGRSVILAIPLGTGEKIRGLRATCILADEFASIAESIYENVVRGFTAVSSTPVQGVQDNARMKFLKEHGIWDEEDDEIFQNSKQVNQSIISGTAYYDFNHFASYWKRYKQIINTQGDPDKIAELLGDTDDTELNWKDFAIIRIPYELIPKGFMEDKQVAQSKATLHSSNYSIEYGACFSLDSNGFYKRSLIESCTSPGTDPSNPIPEFEATLRGRKERLYVFGIDPAAERDNFSIVILELMANHRRVVYCWTTSRQDYKAKLKKMYIHEHDFYHYCARKIRNLMKAFPPYRIGIDTQGGGYQVAEALQNPDYLKEHEELLWPVIDPDKAQDTDGKQGRHILEMVQFAKYDWTANANHGLKQDMEDKMLLFPCFDAALLAITSEIDAESENEFDTLEDNMFEIEELKSELTTIVVTQTSTTSREHWDTPELKLPGGKKGRQKKDRYSALLIANMIARQYQMPDTNNRNYPAGGFAYTLNEESKRRRLQGPGTLYTGPDWFVNAANKLYRG